MSRQFIILWSLLMGATLAWMLWPNSQDGSGDVLATLKSRDGAVQMRRAGSFDWRDAQQGVPLYALDSIATEASSKAVLVLQDGTEIILPADTQLKIQPQSLSKGIEIAVLKGGIAVEQAKVPRVAAKSAGAAAPQPRAGSLKAISTTRYKIDLSTLQGSFRLGADAAVVADKPDTVVVKGRSSNLNLAQLAKDGDQVVESDKSNSIYEIDALPLPLPAAPAAVVPPPPPPPPSPAEAPAAPPAKLLIAAPKPRAPDPSTIPLALAEEDYADLVFPEWKVESKHYWINSPLARSSETPLELPAVWKMENPEGRWQTVFRIGTPGSEKSLIIRRNLGPQGFSFTIREISGILAQPEAELQTITIQAGIVQTADDGKLARFAPQRLALQLHSLALRRPFTLVLDELDYKQPERRWIAARPPKSARIVLHVLNPRRMTELEGFLQSHGSFAIKPFTGLTQPIGLGLVKGPELSIVAEGLAPEEAQKLEKALQLDLIFKGPARAYLGGKGKFDLMKYLETSDSDVYYIHRSLSLKLDTELFKSQAAAREFIRRFNPYFFRAPVDIIYARSN